jgi:hypothetical protein
VVLLNSAAVEGHSGGGSGVHVGWQVACGADGGWLSIMLQVSRQVVASCVWCIWCRSSVLQEGRGGGDEWRAVQVVLVSSAAAGQAGGGEWRAVQVVLISGDCRVESRQVVASGVWCGLCWSAVL